MTLERLGHDAASDRDHYLLALDRIDELPAGFRLPSKHFACLIVGDTRQISDSDMMQFVTALLQAGAVYLCAWGPGCDRAHDLFDDAILTPDYDPSFDTHISTTAHCEELSEALFYLLNCTSVAAAYEQSCRASLVVLIDSPRHVRRVRDALQGQPYDERPNLFHRFASWLGGLRRKSPSLTAITGPNGECILVDEEMLEYLRSSGPDPTQDSLDAMLAQTRRVRVFSGGASGGKPLSNEILCEVTDEIALKSLGVALKIKDGSYRHCMCHGDAALEFSGNSGDRLAVIGVHHGKSIRWDAWHDDAELISGGDILKWLAAHGVS